jgi:hypothetical protein
MHEITIIAALAAEWSHQSRPRVPAFPASRIAKAWHREDQVKVQSTFTSISTTLTDQRFEAPHFSGHARVQETAARVVKLWMDRTRSVHRT